MGRYSFNSIGRRTKFSSVYHRLTKHLSFLQNFSDAAKLKRWGWIGLLFTVLSTSIIFVGSHFSLNHTMTLLMAENQTLREELTQTKRAVDVQIEELERMARRDNNSYRTIYEIPEISIKERQQAQRKMNGFQELNEDPQTRIAADLLLDFEKLKRMLYVQSKSYDAIAKLVESKDKAIECIPSIRPISMREVRISALFGFRKDPISGRRAMHEGIDFSGKKGTPIYAAGRGIVEKAEAGFYGYGNIVLLNHGYGYKTLYAHLSKIGVKVGQKVDRGEVIGALGSSGKSTGPHLHYEVQYRGEPINPINFFSDDMTAEEYEKILRSIARDRNLATDYY